MFNESFLYWNTFMWSLWFFLSKLLRKRQVSSLPEIHHKYTLVSFIILGVYSYMRFEFWVVKYYTNLMSTTILMMSNACCAFKVYYLHCHFPQISMLSVFFWKILWCSICNVNDENSFVLLFINFVTGMKTCA